MCGYISYRQFFSTLLYSLWRYNAQTTIITDLPVCSFVIYLKQGGQTAQSPYERGLPNKEVVHSFRFRAIKLWEIPADIFKQTGLEGLLPLLPLTKNGKTQAVVEDMISSLDRAGKTDLLPLGYAFAALVLKSGEDQDWLQWRFDLLQDILEESWAYQEMVAKGLQQRELQGLREAVLVIVQERFPDIVDFAQKQANALTDAAALRRLVVEVSKAHSSQQAEEALSVSAEDE